MGGVEVNDYLLTEKDAKNLAFEYEDEGYNDVAIENEILAQKSLRGIKRLTQTLREDII